MNKKLKIALSLVLGLSVVLVTALYLRTQSIPVLQPRGIIGHQERSLMIFTVLLGLGVIIPVFILATIIALRYSEKNTSKTVKYTPDWDTHRVAEAVWWAIPIAIIGVLSVVTWVSTHHLDPWKPLAGATKPMTIQVISLDWKWLFIYPEQRIATVNFVQIPVDTPIDFEITSDSVMNSFWVPQLGGQIYSMPGMVTHLNLDANTIGNYDGGSANISGSGFAGMKFTVRASSNADFTAWVKDVRQSPDKLDHATYNKLALPTKNNPVALYASSATDLYDTVIMKYMEPDAAMHNTGTMNMEHN